MENESYLSSEEDDLEEEGSDTSYLAQEIALPPGSYDPAIEIDQQTESNHDTALTLAAAGVCDTRQRERESCVCFMYIVYLYVHMHYTDREIVECVCNSTCCIYLCEVVISVSVCVQGVTMSW